jgi:predicted CXXCH cytochrome family protein
MIDEADSKRVGVGALIEMARAVNWQSRKLSPRKQLALLSLVILGLVVSAVTYRSWSASRSLVTRDWDGDSPYENTRPGVKYQGDAVCFRCHAETARTYRNHPMGRSLNPIASAPAPPGNTASSGPLFTAQGFDYNIEIRNGHVFHTETRRDGSGRIIAQTDGEVQFVVGSGRLGTAYLIERDGFLFQSPIAWYARARRWDLPPGYEKSNSHFERPITSACLFCHSNRAEPVEGTLNRYRPPIFSGHAIGCERCHGPGELHAARPKIVDGHDMTIVNPATLEPSLRDAVCEQCHLNGQKRVLRAGRRDDDFRPGFPFYRFWTVLEPPPGEDENRFVGQFEQMHQSRCFAESKGRLGCISCHDPHQFPEPDQRAAFYRDRCLECHADRGCSLPPTVRTAQGRANDCIRCHMPSLENSDIIHIAETNHRVPRRAELTNRPRAGNGTGNRRPLVNFHGELMDDRERDDTARDFGVALSLDGPEGAAAALPALEDALAARSEDVPAWEAKGYALGVLKRHQDGLLAFQKALSLQPNRESSLAGAAYSAAHGGRREDSIRYWNRAIAINAWRSEYHAELALLYFQSRDWQAAATACRDALRLNPAKLEVRKLLVRCLLRLGDQPAARAEFDTLMAFNPPDRDQLPGWFTSLTTAQ